MEIHKPKPVHSWREFLKEYAIIVLGVLTALSLEQAVEWWHWRDQVAQAREVIATEMTRNLVGAIIRIRTADCIDRRLDALGVILDAAAQSGRLPPMGDIGNPTRQVYPTGAWESVMASQSATHFPRQQLADLSTAYKLVQRLEEQGNRELESWNSLYAMSGPGRRLDPASEARLRDALSQTRTYSRLLASVSVQLIDAIQSLHMQFSQEELSAITRAERQASTMKISVCVPIGAAPANYGQGFVSARTTELAETAKHLPDFSAPAP